MDNFVNLHLHTDASVGDSIIKVPELINQIQIYEQEYVAVTDHGSLANWYALKEACKDTNIKPLFGNEFYCKTMMGKPQGQTRYHLVLLAMNERGAKSIRKMQRLSVKQHFYYKPLLPHPVLFNTNPEGIFVSTACSLSYINQCFLNQKDDIAYDFFNKLLDYFGKDNVAIELQYHPTYIDDKTGLPVQNYLNNKLVELYEDTDAKYIINTFDSHVLLDEDRKLRRKIQSINWKKPESEISETLVSNILGNSDYSYQFAHQSGLEDDKLIQTCIDNTHKIAEKCYFEMPEYERIIPNFTQHKKFKKIFCNKIY